MILSEHRGLFGLLKVICLRKPKLNCLAKYNDNLWPSEWLVDNNYEDIRLQIYRIGPKVYNTQYILLYNWKEVLHRVSRQLRFNAQNSAYVSVINVTVILLFILSYQLRWSICALMSGSNESFWQNHVSRCESIELTIPEFERQCWWLKFNWLAQGH